MANPSNITLREDIDRALTYEEVDDNFQELAALIDEYNAFATGEIFATEIDYVPSSDGLLSTTVQDAIDELSARLDVLEGSV